MFAGITFTWERSLLQAFRVHQHYCSAFLSSQAPPKRPSGSFLLFLKDQNSDGIPRPLFTKQNAEKWRLLSDEEKQPYIEKGSESMKKYREELQAFHDTLSDFELDQLKLEKAQKREARHKRKQKMLKKSLGRPKQPLSAYACYTQSRSVNLPVSLKQVERFKLIAADWNKLSESEKQEFYDKATEDKERYKSELEEYVSNLRSNGREEFIPPSYLTQLRREEKKIKTAKRLQNLIDQNTERLRNL
uniref:Orphan HMG-1 transcription factor protein n=1 Tax=Phallusia mammillata TaxID=59560 RepID=A0A6F9DVL8_9ASCI|nr:Orphan HMG-1 transcription factor protein [Phallusia mammillata]